MKKSHVRIYIFIGAISAFIFFVITQKDILAPFVIAMIFAYVFNPLINFFNNNLKIPRSVSIILVYFLLISSNIFLVSNLFGPALREVESIRANAPVYIQTIKESIGGAPEVIRPFLLDLVLSVQKNNIAGSFTISPLPVVTKAFSGILGFFVFMFAAFFFLKEGRRMAEDVIGIIPFGSKEQLENLLDKINNTLESYLRGQFVIIFSMFVMIFVGLSILGAKYALTIALVTAVLEIITFIGPFTAGIISVILMIISQGKNNFGLDIVQASIAVVLVAYIARVIQDYLIAPFIIGKATKVHPLAILLAVLTGEHVYGILGVLLAVPVVATAKIIFEYIGQELKDSSNK